MIQQLYARLGSWSRGPTPLALRRGMTSLRSAGDQVPIGPAPLRYVRDGEMRLRNGNLLFTVLFVLKILYLPNSA